MPDSPRLRQGRRVPEHVYLQLGPEPSDDDTPLVTLPSADLARWLVAAVNFAEWAVAYEDEGPFDPPVASVPRWEAFVAYREAREAIR